MQVLLPVVLSGFVFAFVSSCASSHNATANANQPAITGILIDQACGAKMMAQDDPQKAAASHTRACAMKDACAASGYAVISGKEMIKFDDTGNQLAKDFLQKTDKTDDLMVTVKGTRTGDMIAVTSITAAQ